MEEEFHTCFNKNKGLKSCARFRAYWRGWPSWFWRAEKLIFSYLLNYEYSGRFSYGMERAFCQYISLFPYNQDSRYTARFSLTLFWIHMSYCARANQTEVCAATLSIDSLYQVKSKFVNLRWGWNMRVKWLTDKTSCKYIQFVCFVQNTRTKQKLCYVRCSTM
jgi:hypothetical protein